MLRFFRCHFVLILLNFKSNSLNFRSITNLDNLPLYVRIEDGMPEVAPYEYINAPFYIDADAETFASVLNGDKDFVVAVAQGSITINGDAAQALVFCSKLF